LVAALFAYRGRERWLVAGGAAASIALIPLLYRGGVYGFPPLTVRSFRSILDSFSAAAIDTFHPHRVAFAFLALAVIGAIALTWRERAIVLAFAILPAAVSLAALCHLNHFFAIRYLACALPGYLLLVAHGVGMIGRRAPVAAIMALPLVYTGLDAARQEPFAKLDWRGIAHAIAVHAKPDHQVLATNDWTDISLGFYLREQHAPVRLLNAGGSRLMALMFLAQQPRGWIASAGLPDPADLRELTCEYPLVRGERLENFRLHYVSSLDHFVATRSTAADRRALLASYGGTIDLTFGSGDATLLDSRWGAPEPEEGRFARWVLGRQAAISLPTEAPADRRIVFDAAPSTGPMQMVVTISDRLAGVVTLTAGRHIYSIDVPRALWPHGPNVLGVAFDHTTAPASTDPKSTDNRPLAARFYRLTVLDAGQPLPPLPPPDRAHRIHLGEAMPRPERALPLPRNVDRAKLAQFAGRLGFDPQTTVLRLLRDELRPAHLAMSIADDSACLDDEAFLHAAWLALLQRDLTPSELAAFTKKLHRGTTRAEIARAIANSEVRGSLAVGR
jgi:hypothetical protein